jgi:hypothetical protein
MGCRNKEYSERNGGKHFLNIIWLELLSECDTVFFNK